MTATDELRALLDERGIDHTDAEDGHTQHTWWRCGDHKVTACASGQRLNVYNLTPEQAVEATVGRWTCTVKHDVVYGLRGCGIDQWACSECGHMWWSIDGRPTCCPSCGAEVIS